MSKIKSFKFTEVIVPANPNTINSEGVYKPLHMLPVTSKGSDRWSVQFDELPKLIVELELENGIVGLGEFYRDHNKEVILQLANNLLGVDITQLSLQELPIGLFREHDGFECAIWDAYAKLKEMPLVNLLGGAVQEKVKVGAWSSYRKLGEMGAVARKFQQQGFDCIKLKAGLQDPVIEWAQEIKEAAPGMDIIYDPNQRWENLGEVKAILRGLEAVGNVIILEDPMPFWMMQDYHDLRNFSSIRIVRHVSLPYIYQGQRPYDIINFLQHRAADGFNFNGGLQQFRNLSAVANNANMYCWHGSEVDLGILEAMYVHQSIAAKSCIWPSDIFGRLIRSHDLLTTPLKIENSYVELPQDGHGLGVKLDRNALDKFQVASYEVS